MAATTGKRTPTKSAANRGKAYEDHEICLIWQVKNTPENAAALAKLLGRTEGAIDFVWRFCEEVRLNGFEGAIGPRASRYLISQIQLWGVTRLGKKCYAKIKKLEV